MSTCEQCAVSRPPEHGHLMSPSTELNAHPVPSAALSSGTEPLAEAASPPRQTWKLLSQVAQRLALGTAVLQPLGATLVITAGWGNVVPAEGMC